MSAAQTSASIKPFRSITLMDADARRAPVSLVTDVLADYPGGSAVRGRCPLCGALWLARLSRVESGESWRCPSCVLEDNRAVWLDPVTRTSQVAAQTSASVEPSLRTTLVDADAPGAPEALPSVIGEAGRDRHSKRLVIARCACGDTWTVRASDIGNGHSKRCPACAKARRLRCGGVAA